MSFHRENVIWRSADGTWSRAFYDFVETRGWDDEDFDPEWDVEYLDRFNWASTGHRSEDEAQSSWRGSNPGGHSVITDPAEAAALDDLVWRFRNPEAAAERDEAARRERVAAEVGELELRSGTYVRLSTIPDPRYPSMQSEMNGTVVRNGDDISVRNGSVLVEVRKGGSVLPSVASLNVAHRPRRW